MLQKCVKNYLNQKFNLTKTNKIMKTPNTKHQTPNTKHQTPFLAFKAFLTLLAFSGLSVAQAQDVESAGAVSLIQQQDFGLNLLRSSRFGTGLSGRAILGDAGFSLGLLGDATSSAQHFTLSGAYALPNVTLSITAAVAREEADKAFNQSQYQGTLTAQQINLGVDAKGNTFFKTIGLNFGAGRAQDETLGTSNVSSTQSRTVDTGSAIQVFEDTYNTPTTTRFNGQSWVFANIKSVIDILDNGELTFKLGADKRSNTSMLTIGGLQYTHYIGQQGKLNVFADATARQQSQYGFNYSLPIAKQWAINAGLQTIHGGVNDTRASIGLEWAGSGQLAFVRPTQANVLHANLVTHQNLQNTKNQLIGIASFGELKTTTQGRTLVASRLVSTTPTTTPAALVSTSTLSASDIGATAASTVQFTQALTSVTVGSLPTGMSGTATVSGTDVSLSLSTNGTFTSFGAVTVPITVVDANSNSVTINLSKTINDVAPIFAGQADATVFDEGGGFDITDQSVAALSNICPTGTDQFGRTIVACNVTVINPPISGGGGTGLAFSATTNRIEGTIDVGQDSVATVTRVISVQGSSLTDTDISVINIRNNG